MKVSSMADDRAMPFAPRITLTQALTSPSLFGRTFAAPSFWTWRTVAKLIDNIPLTEQREIDLFKQCSGRTQLLSSTSNAILRRFIVLVGRRGGKDRFFSAVAVWRAALCTDWRQYLSAGEQAVVILLGKDKKQAAILRRYCHGLLQVEAIKREVVRETNDVIEFRNGAVLEISANDASLVRGRSAIAVIGSETAYWKQDEHSASSDEEVVGSAEPSMAMCPDGGLLLLGSSVYRQRGYMYRKYRELFANDASNDICWFAPSKVMNPRLPQAVVDAAMAEDPQRYGAEYLNRWREDLSDFCPLDVIESCTDWNVFERSPQPNVHYFAFTDNASGTGSDSFTLCISHRLSDEVATVAVDAIRERKPRFVPSDTIKDFCTLLKSYGIVEVHGDAYAGGMQDEWLRGGIRFIPAEFNKSEYYLRALPMLLNRRASLLNSATLRTQFASLERRVVGGYEKVDHPAHFNAHDDVANAVAGALVVAGNRLGFDTTWSWVNHDDANPIAPVAETDEQRTRREESEANARWRQSMYFNSLGIF